MADGRGRRLSRCGRVPCRAAAHGWRTRARRAVALPSPPFAADRMSGHLSRWPVPPEVFAAHQRRTSKGPGLRAIARGAAGSCDRCRVAGGQNQPFSGRCRRAAAVEVGGGVQTWQQHRGQVWAPLRFCHGHGPAQGLFRREGQSPTERERGRVEW